jgi:hypothetical protein
MSVTCPTSGFEIGTGSILGSGTEVLGVKVTWISRTGKECCDELSGT